MLSSVSDNSYADNAFNGADSLNKAIGGLVDIYHGICVSLVPAACVYHVFNVDAIGGQSGGYLRYHVDRHLVEVVLGVPAPLGAGAAG